MASVVPETLNDKISFFEQRLSLWAANSAQLGVQSSDVTQLATLVTQARALYNAAQSARNAAKSATVSQNVAVENMFDLGSDLVKTIKAKALTTNNPNIYALSQIPPPAAPSPVGTPATPTNLTGAIDASGLLTLAWRAERAGPTSGIVFQVSRKRYNESNFTLIGSTFDTAFADNSFDAASGPFSYRVQALRGVNASAFAGPLLINVGGAAISGANGETIGGEHAGGGGGVAGFVGTNTTGGDNALSQAA
jgi:hypothetical protein